MTRRTGVTAGRDAGSTTGVATAVLALLSAGALATLGVVTAGELQDVGRAPAQGSRVDGVGPPVAIALTPPSVAPPAPGGSGTGGGRGSGGVRSLPDVLATGSTGTSRPGLSGTAGSPASPAGGTSTPSPTPTPTPTPGPAVRPVFAGVTPTPTPSPSTSVLAEKAGRHLGRLRHGKPVRPAKVRATATIAAEQPAAATRPASSRGRAVGRGHGPGKPAVTPVGPVVSTPSATVVERACAGRGPQLNGHGHGPAEVPLAYSPVTAGPAAAPTPTAGPDSTDVGHGNGRAVGLSTP